MKRSDVMSNKRVGFYVKNSFQVSHLRNLFNSTKNAQWVGKRVSSLKSFGISEKEPVATSTFFLRKMMEKQFDIIVSHAAPPAGVPLEDTYYVMVQYGYAKAVYNFGDWRKSADLILSYGTYAERKFAQFGASIAIGNPRFDDWSDHGFQTSSKLRISPLLDANLKTVVYAPTWGELSSIEEWLESIIDLSAQYNVLVKLHHNSIKHNAIRLRQLPPNVHILPGEDLFSLFCVADVLISDVSGAIFDALMCELPVVLVAPSGLSKRYGKKLNETSLEIAHRHELGTVVGENSDLKDAVCRAIVDKNSATAEWRKKLFRTDGSVSKNFKNALNTLG